MNNNESDNNKLRNGLENNKQHIVYNSFENGKQSHNSIRG